MHGLAASMGCWGLQSAVCVCVCMRVCCLQIFSCFLPKVNLVRTSSWAKDNDDKSFSFDDSAILIKRGVLIHGGHANLEGS